MSKAVPPTRRLLAIETSSRTGSVALEVDGAVLERSLATPREQTERVLALVDALLAEAALGVADLDALVFGRGPGSFTGLRIAAAVVQGLSLVSERPIIAVSSLAALGQRGLTECARNAEAAGAPEGPRREGGAPSALCCVDARMGEVYWAGYRLEEGLAAVVEPDAIGGPERVRAPAAGFVALGDGFAAYPEALAEALGAALEVDTELVPRAQDLLPLAAADLAAGRFAALEAALPVYLREADAWRKDS